MDDNKRHAISPVRNKNMGVDAMGEPWVPPNNGQNDLMENMKAFNNVYSKIHTNSTIKLEAVAGLSGVDDKKKLRQILPRIHGIAYAMKGTLRVQNE